MEDKSSYQKLKDAFDECKKGYLKATLENDSYQAKIFKNKMELINQQLKNIDRLVGKYYPTGGNYEPDSTQTT